MQPVGSTCTGFDTEDPLPKRRLEQDHGFIDLLLPANADVIGFSLQLDRGPGMKIPVLEITQLQLPGYPEVLRLLLIR